jgi:hypothetical protein
VWGWLITACRLKGLSYEKSYALSLSTFCSGKEGIIDFLDGITDPSLTDRINNMDIDFSNFFYWGSISYLI